MSETMRIDWNKVLEAGKKRPAKVYKPLRFIEDQSRYFEVDANGKNVVKYGHNYILARYAAACGDGKTVQQIAMGLV